MEIKLSRGEGCYHINRFNPRTFLCLSQARTWISIIIRHGLFMFNDLRWELIVYFVNIGGIVDHHCLNFLIIKDNLLYYILCWWTMNNVDIYQRSFIFYLYFPSNPILILSPLHWNLHNFSYILTLTLSLFLSPLVCLLFFFSLLLYTFFYHKHQNWLNLKCP